MKISLNLIAMYFIVNVLSSLLPVPVFAVDPNPPGELRVDVVASDSHDYIDQWTHTSSETAIHIKPIRYVIPDQTFYVAVLVSGYGVGDKGNIDLSGGFVLQNPDGTLMFDEKNVFKLARSMSDSKGFLMMDPAIDLFFEKKDQRGVYIFKAIIRDNILNKTAEGQYDITLVEKNVDEQGKRDDIDAILETALAAEGLTIKDFDKSTSYYYQNPQPEKLTPILKAILTQEKLIANTVHFGPLLHFFATIAHNNRSFLDHLKDIKNTYSGIQKNSIQKIIDQAEDFKSPMPDSVENLDYLWGEFSATGNEEPVKKIISVLSYPDKGENIILIGAAEWSLAANARQHKKVREIVEKESLSSTGKLRERLDGILKKD